MGHETGPLEVRHNTTVHLLIMTVRDTAFEKITDGKGSLINGSDLRRDGYRCTLVNKDRPAVRTEGSCNQFEDGSFPSPVLTHQHDTLTAAHRKTSLVQKSSLMSSGNAKDTSFKRTVLNCQHRDRGPLVLVAQLSCRLGQP